MPVDLNEWLKRASLWGFPIRWSPARNRKAPRDSTTIPAQVPSGTTYTISRRAGDSPFSPTPEPEPEGEDEKMVG